MLRVIDPDWTSDVPGVVVLEGTHAVHCNA